MSIASEAAADGQAQAEALMEDTCRITREGIVTTTEDGQDSTDPQVIYEGPCRVKPLSTGSDVSSGSNAPSDHWQYRVSVPVNDVLFNSGDAVVFLQSQDPYLLNKRMRIRNIEGGTHVTARRFWCTEVSR